MHLVVMLSVNTTTLLFVKGGRTFVRRLIDSLSNVNNRNAKILLSSEFFDDIAWWVKFMNKFNGTVKFLFYFWNYLC
jgi:hypothetical protein